MSTSSSCFNVYSPLTSLPLILIQITYTAGAQGFPPKPTTRVTQDSEIMQVKVKPKLDPSLLVVKKFLSTCQLEMVQTTSSQSSNPIG